MHKKLCQFLRIYGVFMIISFTWNLISQILLLSGYYFEILEIYFPLSIVFGIISFSSVIILIVGFYKAKQVDHNPQIQKLYTLSVIVLAVQLLSIFIQGFVITLLLSIIDTTMHTYGWWMNLMNLLWSIPQIIFMINFFLWTNSLKMQNPSFNSTGYYIMMIAYIAMTSFRFISIISLEILLYFARFGPLIMMPFYIIGWFLTVNQISQIPEGSVNEPLVRNMSYQNQWISEDLENQYQETNMQNPIYCRNCNKMQRTLSGKFCEHCGTKIDRQI